MTGLVVRREDGRCGHAILFRDQLPPGQWACELDSTQPDGRSAWVRAGQAAIGLPARSVLLLRDAAP